MSRNVGAGPCMRRVGYNPSPSPGEIKVGTNISSPRWVEMVEKDTDKMTGANGELN